jgi:hypothetical protein
MNQSALELWKQKLNYLQEQEAIAADPSIQFQLQKQIEECQRKIEELGGQVVSQPSNSPQPTPRKELMRLLNQLIPQQFNELLFDLSPPPGIIPPYPAPQADRVYALLTWAESPTGVGLSGIQTALDRILNP